VEDEGKPLSMEVSFIAVALDVSHNFRKSFTSQIVIITIYKQLTLRYDTYLKGDVNVKIKITLFSLIFVLSTLLVGCNTKDVNTAANENKNAAEKQEQTEKLTIYTTLFPLEDFTKKIGGEFVEVTSIIPLGADAHTYEPTSKEMVNIAQSEAFIFNGLGMEPYAEKMGEALKNEKTLLVEATHDIEVITHDDDHHESEENEHDEKHHDGEETGHDEDHHDGEENGHDEDHHDGEENGHEDHHHGDFDPHVWLDPYRAIHLAENIKNALVELMPAEKETFETNFNSLREELEKLDSEFQQLVESKEQPEILVSHAAYGYWEESYGIHQIPVSGLSPSNEPSQKALEKIIDLANEKQIKYVLFEQNVTPKIAEIIRQEIKAEPLHLHNLSVLTQEDIENNEDYFSLMRKNIETLNKALK
jgi:zinc transport system substrate-binding protein